MASQSADVAEIKKVRKPVSPIAVAFGNSLAYERERRELSQEELGIRAGLHRTEISQLERGLRVCRIDTLVRLAGALGTEAEVLLRDLPSWTPAELSPGEYSV